ILNNATIAREEGLPRTNGSYFTVFTPISLKDNKNDPVLKFSAFDPDKTHHFETLLLYSTANSKPIQELSFSREACIKNDIYGLATNNKGAMSFVRSGWGEIASQYDALLAANLNSACPVDRHIMFTRCRAWLLFRGYSYEINKDYLINFNISDNNTLFWHFEIPCGMGKTMPLSIKLNMLQDKNEISLTFIRPESDPNPNTLDKDIPVNIILRPDIEDRNFHTKTKAFTEPESKWVTAVDSRHDGFKFSLIKEQSLNMSVSKGTFKFEPDWTYMVGHPIDAERGLGPHTDLFSPGWFSIALNGGARETLTATAMHHDTHLSVPQTGKTNDRPETFGPDTDLEDRLKTLIKAYIVDRDNSKTVIAGYPWFLDWGRDTLICLRGITAAGMLEEAADILEQFAKFEHRGTIPNMIRGNDISNRNTSDAPLWLFTACSDLIKAGYTDLPERQCGDRNLLDILISIATWYMKGTDNGIKMDPESGLIFSPSHYTWMDTNHPAGSPREGYPIEIQALWHAALSLLSGLDPNRQWDRLADQVKTSIKTFLRINALENAEKLNLPEPFYHAFLGDCLHARPGTSAADAAQGDALRPNQLFAITLDCLDDIDLKTSVLESCEELLVPGGIRSLADRPVLHNLPVYRDGHLLNDPTNPYWGEYTGDEDTRRKPAYHNGTVWAWPFPSYCEAMLKVRGESAKNSALAILSSASEFFNSGCVGHLPEIADGNIPHTQKGCGAQAWSLTEFYRVLKLLT
ncbi:MAG: glycogen debranching protein, partial [Lentisphaerae bacterium]|nr:glycogen debranching protein [Lentisphaerota bacterium]